MSPTPASPPARPAAAPPPPTGRRSAAIVAVGLALALAFAAIGLRQQTPAPSGLEGQQAPRGVLPVLTATPQPKPTRVPVPMPGKRHLLHFWGPNCAPCVEEAPVIQRLHRAAGGPTGAFAVVTVSAEDVPDIRGFMRDKGYDFPVLLDANGFVHGQFRVSAIPATFVVDAKGVVVRELRGPQGYDELHGLLVGR